MKKQDSLILDRMLPRFNISSPSQKHDYYPGSSHLIELYDGPEHSWGRILMGEGFFYSERPDEATIDTPYYLWLPDEHGVCKITDRPAPYNKFFGVLYFDWMKLRAQPYTVNRLYLSGLSSEHEVVFDLSD